jgi:hypothetical protein
MEKSEWEMTCTPISTDVTQRNIKSHSTVLLQCTLDYPHAYYPVCGLSVHHHDLLKPNDECGK